MNLSLKKLFINSSKIFSGSIGISIISFLQGVIISRALGPSQYGVLGIIMAYCMTIKAFLSFRTSEPLTKAITEFYNSHNQVPIKIVISTALITELTTSLLSVVFIYFSINWFGAFLHSLDMVNIRILYYIFGLSVVFTFTDSVWYSLLRHQKDFNKLAYIPVVTKIVHFVTILILLAGRLLSLETVIATFLFISIFTMFLQLYYIRRSLIFYNIATLLVTPKELRQGQQYLKGFWRFMLATYFSNTFTSLAKNVDILILGWYRSNTEVGLYRLAKNLIIIIQQVSTSLTSVIYQEFNELVIYKRFREIKKAIIRLIKYLLPMVVLGTLLSVSLSKNVIMVVFGGIYELAYIPFNVLVIGVAINMLFFWAQPMVLAFGLYRENLIITSLFSFLSFIFMLLFTQAYGSFVSSLSLALTWVMISLSLALFAFREITKCEYTK